MLLGSLVLSYATDVSAVRTKLDSFCSLLAQAPHYVGWAVCVWMFMSIVLALTEIHKLIYDSGAKSQHEDENSQDRRLEQFMNNLNGPTKISKRPVLDTIPKGGKS